MKRLGEMYSDQPLITVIGGIVGLFLLGACDTADNDALVSQESSPSGKVSGTVSYRERIALPPDAAVEVMLLDVSRKDVAATTIARRTIEPSGQVPIPYELVYDRAVIDSRMEYAVRALIRRGDNILFVTDRSYPVLTRGNPDSANLVLVRSGGGAAPVADANLSGTRWELKTLAGEYVNLEASQKTYFLQFNDGKKIVTGFVGCNNFTGEYSVSETTLEFANLARTMRICPSMAIEDRFHDALQVVERHEIRGTWLILFGLKGELAAFEAWYE